MFRWKTDRRFRQGSYLLQQNWSRLARFRLRSYLLPSYQGIETGPGCDMYYVKDENPDHAKRIEIINEEQAKALNDLLQPPVSQWGIGKDFRILTHSNGGLDFVYEE